MNSRAPRPKSKIHKEPTRKRRSAPPEVQISYSPVGHETLAAIQEQLSSGAGPRSVKRDEDPEISVREGPVGRETLALIADLVGPVRAVQETLNYEDRIANAPFSNDSRTPIALAVVELRSFVVQGGDASQLGSEASRRNFVATHLLRHLPAAGMSQVERVDVTPSTLREAFIVSVWYVVR